MRESPYDREPGYAQRYRDRWWVFLNGGRIDRRQRHLLRSLLLDATFGPGAWLDAPCGAGRLSEELPGAVVQVDRDEAMAFLAALRNPGKAYRDGRFIPSLAQERGIAKKQMGKFMPEVNEAAREILLKDPSLVDDPNSLKGAVRSRVITATGARRVALLWLSAR